MDRRNNTVEVLLKGSSHVAKMIFFTKGKGLHKDYLTSFESALRETAISDRNLVSIFSIMPSQCKIVGGGGRKKISTARTDRFYGHGKGGYQ